MRYVFWKALIGLMAFDVMGFGRDFARMHKFLRKWRVVSRPVPRDIVERVCDTMNSACLWYPKRVLCLQRSAVTTCLLRSLGVHAQMVMGARKVPFKAHAWVEVDGRAINERSDVQRIYGIWERC
jgi:hypothetical protein